MKAMRQLVTAGREGQPSPGCPAQCRPADLERTCSDDRHGNCQRPDACATGRSRTTSSPARRTGTRRAADHQSDCPLRDERLRRHLGNPGPRETVEPYVPALGDDACRGGEERFSVAVMLVLGRSWPSARPWCATATSPHPNAPAYPGGLRGWVVLLGVLIAVTAFIVCWVEVGVGVAAVRAGVSRHDRQLAHRPFYPIDLW
jgi:hypothetical protein